MKKLLLLLTLAILVLVQTGCTAGPMIQAPSNAVPYSDMPASPPGLVRPEEHADYTTRQEDGGLAALESGSRRIYCEYAVAPGASELLEQGLDEKRVEDFAAQYAEGLENGFTREAVDFMGARGLLLSGPLNADTEYGKAGEYAVYVMAPYGDYFVMVYGFAPSAEQEGIRGDVEGYLGGFAIDNAPAPAVSK